MRFESSRPCAAPLETLFRLGTTASLPDAQLLDHFVAHRGEHAEAAFAALVERHGPMVMRVCRRILADPHDADDAFQVTFLVVARKARSIAGRAAGQLAPWRHRPHVPRRPQADVPPPRSGGPGEGTQSGRSATNTARRRSSAIDEELSRLPGPSRAAVVLCDLEEKTHIEAARLLGVPVATVTSRLVRARERLRGRLARRGLDPAAAEPTQGLMPIVLPPALVADTARAATRLAAGGLVAGTIPPHLVVFTSTVVKGTPIGTLLAWGVLASTFLAFTIAVASVGFHTILQCGPADAPDGPAASSSGDW